jgi:hypothetical protein
MRKAVAGLLLGIVVVLFIAMSASYAAIPRLVTIEGKLRNSTTNAPLVGVYNITLGVWTASVSGTQLFVENITTTTDTFGIFQVIMGSVKLLDTTFPNPSYLEVTVNGTTLSPRHTLTSSPTTFRANTSNYAEDLSCTGCVGTNDIANAAVTSDKYNCLNLTTNLSSTGINACTVGSIAGICDDADGCTIRMTYRPTIIFSAPPDTFGVFYQPAGRWRVTGWENSSTSIITRTGTNGDSVTETILWGGGICQLRDDEVYWSGFSCLGGGDLVTTDISLSAASGTSNGWCYAYICD